MATTVTVAGSSYSIPAEGDSNYATDLTNFFIQIATSTKVLQVSSSNFPITQDVSFGSSYGLKLQYLKSQATNPAASGQVRLGNTESVSWRNAANNADLGLSVNASDVLEFNGTGLSVGGDPVQTAITVSDTATIDLTLAADNISADIKPLSITNALVSASAAIDYSKLSVPAGAVTYSKLTLTNSVVNADIASSAAIAYSKLSLASSIVNSDVSASAAIAYSKLNLSTSIVNADISASAAIALSKLATVTASRALVSDGSGVVSASAVTSTELALLSGRTGTLATLAGTETLTNKTLTSPAINTPRIDVITLDGQASSPSNPSAGDYKLFVADSTQKLTLRDSTGAETTVGSGSGGGINYVINPDAEVSTTGWATYADAAGTAPVDGTGGSPSSTFTRSTSSPLVGTASFLWTKSANNRQGEGFSYDFTIDSGYQGQQLAINYLLQVASGTFVTGDMTVWIYDKTNAALIQPSAFQVVNTSIAGPVQSAVFQAASNSTSYRLIVHTSTTSALAYTLKFDGFSVGPQVVPVGFAGSDSVTYTPAIGNGTNGAIVKATWSRQGDRLIMEGGAAWSGAGSGSTITIALPAGLVIDTTKVNASAGNQRLGGGLWADSGTGRFLLNAVYSSTTTFEFQQQTTSALVGTQMAAGDFLTWNVEVPIVGWSSNTIVSSSAATRSITFATNSFTTNTMVGGGASTQITGGTAVVDTVGGFASNAYTVRVPGQYMMTVAVATGPGASSKAINVYKNGVVQSNWGINISGVNAYGGGSGTIVADLIAGDVITIYGYNAPASETWTINSWTMTLIQGPAQIQAATVVAACYTGTPTGTLNGSYNIATFPTKQVDTHNAYSGGTYTVPAPGLYEINAFYDIQATITANQYATISIFKNGSGLPGAAYGPYLPAVAGTTPSISGYLCNLVAGDLITIRSLTNTSSPAYQPGSMFSIRRLNGVN